MKNTEFKQHEEQADAQASAEPPSDGLRRLQEAIEETDREFFSFEAITTRLNNWNRAYAASHDLLDDKKARIARVMEAKTV
jgi:hypothetical protein